MCTYRRAGRTPKETLVTLGKDKDPDVRRRVAANPNAPKETLTTLSSDTDWYARRFVAANPSTPPDVLTELAGDDDSEVCERVAINPNTLESTLMEIVWDYDEHVRLAVLQNPKVTNEMCVTIYNEVVQNDLLDEGWAVGISEKGVLSETEMLALISLYGQNVAQAVAEKVTVTRGSLLEKILHEHGQEISKRPVDKNNDFNRAQK